MGLRTDLDRYKNGCKTLTNMYVKSQGPAVRRPGLEFIYDLGEYDSISWTRRPRIVPFVFGTNEAFVLVFVPKLGEAYYTIYVANSEGLVTDSEGDPVLVIPESDKAATWAVGTAYTLSDYVVPITTNGYYYKCVDAGTSHATTEPTWPTGTGSRVTDNGAIWLNMGAVTAPIDSNEPGLQYTQVGDIIYVAFASGSRSPIEIKRKNTAGTVWEYLEVPFDNYPQQPGGIFTTSCSGVTPANQAKCEKYEGTWVTGGTCASYVIEDSADCTTADGIWIAECRNYRIFDELSCNEAGGRWVAQPISTQFPYGGDCRGEIIPSETLCENMIYLGQWYEACEAFKIDNQSDCETLTGTWTASTPYCQTWKIRTKTDCLKEGGTWDPKGSKPWWGSNLGWPTTVSAYQQRLAFGSTWKRPQTIWLSAIQDLYNFNTSPGDNGLVADQAMAFTLASEDQNAIRWMKATRSLLVGTYGDEWTIDGGISNAITPTNIMALRHTNQGSERVQPLLIGPAVLFVERLGRIVNELVYDYNYQSYKVNDMTVLAPHLTEENSIVDWAFQQTPNSIVWAIRDDGTLLGLTYQREQKVVAWHNHNTAGYFMSIGATPGKNRETDIWVVVARLSGIEGNGSWCLEKLQTEFRGTDTMDSLFLDSHTIVLNPESLTFTETRFAGKTVHAICDGIVHAPVVADSSGVFTLSFGTSKVVYGLQYISELIPELLEQELRDGTSMGRTQRIVDVNVLFSNSVGMKIGDGTYYEDVQARDASQDVNTQPTTFSGYHTINFPEGYDSDPSISIIQEKPLPLTVIGLVDTVEVNK